jgi:hypothetical protein
VTAFAQSSGKFASSADAWNNVITLATPIPATKAVAPVSQGTVAPAQNAATNISNLKSTINDIQVSQSKQTDQYWQASQSAKDFYTTYPTDVNAPAAKKIEVVTALQGVPGNDQVKGQSAQQLAQNYRTDKNNPVSDRFEVAVLAERQKLSSKSGGKLFVDSPKDLESMTESLHKEFGDIDEVFRFYASVARSADMDTANRVAGELLQWSAAPAETKAEAQSIRDRQNLVGQVLNAQWPTMDGKTFDLSQQTGKITIVYVWSTAGDPQGMGGLLSLKKTMPANAQMVYLALGGAADQLQALKDSAPISGTFCFEAINAASPARDVLRVRHTPFVFVLNKTGKLSGFGPVSELSNLVSAASH